MDAVVGDGLRGRVDALAAHHKLDSRVAITLESHARVLDWEAGNFLPATAPELPTPNMRLSEREAHTAANMIGEALSALELEPVRTARRMADIGSGAGFPGLVLAIALPETRVALVESDTKKAPFLRAVSDSLGLRNVEIVASPLQAWTEGVGACDLVTSRRVWRPDTILERVAPLLTDDGSTVRFGKNSEEVMPAESNGLRLEVVHPVTTENHRGKIRSGKRRLYLYKRIR